MANIVNEHLSSYNNKPLPAITLDLAKATPYTSNRSGLVDPGNYVLETADVVVRERKDGNGFNLLWTDRIVGPAGPWEGTTIITTHPAPFGPDGSQSVRDGNSWMMTRIGAYYSMQGKSVDDIRKDGVTVDADAFRGKRFAAALKPGMKKSETEDYSDRSQIDTYLTKAQFDLAPGPRKARGSAAPNGSGTDLLNTGNGARLDV